MTPEALNDKWQEFSFLLRGVEFGTNSLKVSPIDNYRLSGGVLTARLLLKARTSGRIYAISDFSTLGSSN